MPDYFSSSLGLFLALSLSVSRSLLPYAGRIENNSATDGRQHARPCPTRLRIHFICARGEWIKINDGRTFIAFWGWRRDWRGERRKLWHNTCASNWARLDSWYQIHTKLTLHCLYRPSFVLWFTVRVPSTWSKGPSPALEDQNHKINSPQPDFTLKLR